MARIVVLGGSGGVGRTAVRALASAEDFDEIVVADLREDVSRTMARPTRDLTQEEIAGVLHEQGDEGVARSRRHQIGEQSVGELLVSEKRYEEARTRFERALALVGLELLDVAVRVDPHRAGLAHDSRGNRASPLVTGAPAG